jgi:hypothetical protein
VLRQRRKSRVGPEQGFELTVDDKFKFAFGILILDIRNFDAMYRRRRRIGLPGQSFRGTVRFGPQFCPRTDSGCRHCAICPNRSARLFQYNIHVTLLSPLFEIAPSLKRAISRTRSEHSTARLDDLFSDGASSRRRFVAANVSAQQIEHLLYFRGGFSGGHQISSFNPAQSLNQADRPCQVTRLNWVSIQRVLKLVCYAYC